ncbi:hypothetical protein FQ186_05150 [Pseudomonas sp. ANT_H14]|uniref:lipopolysaccharide biosynthesis protein n=1 Tax=unclassified Pseudomonas TaxID=196821 RepID=UPI0011EC6990|nr:MULTISPECIES: hypothetical protein [unclassified Pseudomonas]KAA0947507.1 hypothetical protein FQ182_10665 [Pseudomonas sp. ANT_H4]KAA0953925.1 hypothetical protein FQ186_05150 [Pseudomonas sp. ANT_H14]
MQNKTHEFQMLLFGVALVSVASLLTNVGLANVFGSSKFGEYSYVLLLGMIIGQIIVFGSDQYAVKFHFDHARSDVASKIFVFRIINFLIVSIAVMTWSLVENNHVIPYALIVASQVLGIPYSYEISGKNVRCAVINVVEKFLYHAAIWVGIFFFEDSSFIFVFGVLLFWTIVSLVYQFIDRSIRLTSMSMPDRSMFTFGFWLLIFGLTKQMYGTGTRLFVEHNLGFSALAVYSLVWQVVPLVSTFLEQGVKSWRVKITSSIVLLDIVTLKNSIKQMTISMIIPVLLGAIVMNLLGREVISYILPPEYEPMTLLLPWLGLYVVIVALDVVVSVIWIAIGKIKIFNFLYFGLSVACFCLLYYFGSDFEMEEYLFTVVIFHGAAVLASACITTRLLIIIVKESV